MWKLLALFLLAAACPGPALGKVVSPEDAGFAECDAFFYERTPPQGALGGQQPQHVKICQLYKREPRFATLYSTRHRAPLYAAFRFSEAAPGGEECWLVEPQVSKPRRAGGRAGTGRGISGVRDQSGGGAEELGEGHRGSHSGRAASCPTCLTLEREVPACFA